jgi:phage tail tape-measure protein
MIRMKKLLLLSLIAGVVLAGFGCGPSYRTQQGAVIGAALGAWAGQDIGHDPESTLIGAAVGGVTGAVIGDAVEQYESDNAYRYNYPPYEQQPYNQAPPRRY